MEITIAVGTAYIAFSAVGLILNAITIIAIFANGMLKNKYNNRPFGQLLLYILDSAQSYCFFNNSLSHVSLAVNRLIATVLYRLDIFTTTRTIAISMAQHLLALSITITAQYGLRCCWQVLEYTIFNFRTALIPGVPNDSHHIRLSIKIACSTIPLIIYSTILLSSHSIGGHLKLHSAALAKRRKQELKFAAQFASIAVVYTLSWLLFTLLPTSPVASNWMNGLPALVSLVNATANALIFIFNERKKLCSCRLSTASPIGSVHNMPRKLSAMIPQ